MLTTILINTYWQKQGCQHKLSKLNFSTQLQRHTKRSFLKTLEITNINFQITLKNGF